MINPMHGTQHSIRGVLARNFDAVRKASVSLSSLPLISKSKGPANGTLGRILKTETGATIDTLAELAAVYGMQAWQLLLPNLQAAPNGTNHPTLIGVPGWPFSIVSQPRYDSLTEEEKGFVQGRFLQAIEDCEAKRPKRALKPVAKRLSSAESKGK